MPAKTLLTLLVLLGLALPLGGCGGALGALLLEELLEDDDDGGGGPPAPRVFTADPALDGSVASTGAVVTAGGRPVTGDIDGSVPGGQERQFVSFDIASLGPGASIVSARLELWQAAVTGTPYATHGSVVIEAVDYGATLEAGDFGSAVLGGPLALSSGPPVGLKVLDVTALLQSAIAAARTRFQVRLRFSPVETDLDGASDYAEFGDAELSAPGAQAPRLVVQQ